jgi:uroporphyrinogen-III synthase
MPKSANTGNTAAPLKGVRVLVSRAKKQAGALSAELRARGASVLEIPFIEIREPQSFAPLDTSIRNALNYDWLILTSVNGVNALFGRMERLKLRPDLLEHLKVAAIGPATKKAIEAEGLKVHVTPKEYVAESVVDALAAKVNGKRVLLVRAKVARDVIPRELRKAGAVVDVVEAYETVVPERSRGLLMDALHSLKNKPKVITFTSSSTVRNFVDLIGKREAARCFKGGVRSASIGPVTSATLREFKLPVDVQAKEFTIPGLVTAITSAREQLAL